MNRLIKQVQGFTLIEMLVALLMIAILFTLVFEALSGATASREGTREAGDNLADLQRTFMWMDQDINQLIPRSIRDAYGTTQKSIVHSEASSERVLEFTRSGWPNPMELNRSDIVRVAYELAPDEKANSRRKKGEPEVYSLYRIYWRDADRADEEPTRRRRIARHVRALKVRFMDDKRSWQSSWPPLNQGQGGDVMPRAIELELDTQDWGKLRRVFRVVTGHGL